DEPVGVGTIEAFSSASFRRLPVRQFRARLCDSGQALQRVEAQVAIDLTPPFVLFYFAAQSESHYYCSLHRFRASQRDMKALQKSAISLDLLLCLFRVVVFQLMQPAHILESGDYRDRHFPVTFDVSLDFLSYFWVVRQLI